MAYQVTIRDDGSAHIERETDIEHTHHDITAEQARRLRFLVMDLAGVDRLSTPGKVYNHDAREDDLPDPVTTCRVCGEDITWVGPSGSDWLHVDEVVNRTPTDTCRHCQHGIVQAQDGTWCAPDAGTDREGGDGIWLDSCPDNDTCRAAPHVPESAYVLHYVSEDHPATEPHAWSVYRELYPDADSDVPFDGSQEHVSTHATEGEANAEAERLQAEHYPA